MKSPERRRVRTGFRLLLLAFWLGGCTIGQDYQEPELDALTPQRWLSGEAAGGQFELKQPSPHWWRQFEDPQLTRLVNQLFSSNLALAQARERVEETAARHGVVEADQRLQLAAALGYTYLGSGDTAVSLQGVPAGKTLEVYSAGVTAAWELDLWGRTARLLEAAEQDIGSAWADYQGMQVSLAAELTLAYVELRTVELRLRQVRRQLGFQEQLLDLTRDRHQAGNGTAVAVVRTERLLESTRARLPGLQQRLTAATHRLGLLLGRPPGRIDLEPGTMPSVPRLIGLGLPAELLTRRADIRRAVHQYHAAVARTGAAEALSYPTLTLSGTLKLSSDAVESVFDPEALSYSLGPGLYFPILTGRRIESKVAAQASRAEQARLVLEQQLLSALVEVENAIDGIRRSRERAAALERESQLAERAVALTESLYRAGLGTYIEVLDSRQQLMLSREKLALVNQQVLTEVVRLYRALGGGWQQPPEISGELAGSAKAN